MTDVVDRARRDLTAVTRDLLATMDRLEGIAVVLRDSGEYEAARASAGDNLIPAVADPLAWDLCGSGLCIRDQLAEVVQVLLAEVATSQAEAAASWATAKREWAQWRKEHDAAAGQGVAESHPL